MLFKRKKREFNVRKVHFTIRKVDNTSVVVEVTGKIKVRKFLFFTFYSIQHAIPDKIIFDWGNQGFIKVGTREFLNTSQVVGVTFKSESHIIEK